MNKDEEKRIEKEEPAILRLDFENGEDIDININDINTMELKGVSESHYIAIGYKFVEKHKYCEYLSLYISKSADKSYKGAYEGLTAFQRVLKFNDIVSVTYLNKAGDYLDRIYVSWDHNGSDEENNYQKNKLTQDRDLVISIRKVG